MGSVGLSPQTPRIPTQTPRAPNGAPGTRTPTPTPLTFCLPRLGQQRSQLQDALLLHLHRLLIVLLDVAFHWKRAQHSRGGSAPSAVGRTQQCCWDSTTHSSAPPPAATHSPHRPSSGAEVPHPHPTYPTSGPPYLTHHTLTIPYPISPTHAPQPIKHSLYHTLHTSYPTLYTP